MTGKNPKIEAIRSQDFFHFRHFDGYIQKFVYDIVKNPKSL